MSFHILSANRETIHWGYLDSSLKDVLTIEPGDTVEIETFSGGRNRLPQNRHMFPVQEGHQSVIDTCVPKIGPHILTGPIHIKGAEPGDLLSVQVNQIKMTQNWGWNQICPGDGPLLELEIYDKVVTIPIDLATSEVILPWARPEASRIPAMPFHGVMAVKPDHGDGPVSSLVPGVFGGNMDIRLLGAGATIFFPVHQAGAGFSVGDGHALQGDGEVCGTAVETALTSQFTFDVLKGAVLTKFPFAEREGLLITMAVDPDLNTAMKEALTQAIHLLHNRYEITPQEAYRHCSLTGNLAISQVVNRNLGVHLTVPVFSLPPRLSAPGAGLASDVSPILLNFAGKPQFFEPE